MRAIENQKQLLMSFQNNSDRKQIVFVLRTTFGGLDPIPLSTVKDL